MNLKCGVSALYEACHRKMLNRTLEKYIKSCHGDNSDGAPVKGGSRMQKKIGRFPNIAGFCRYYHVSIEELCELEKEFPEEIRKLYAILEDEALNSGLPPAVISAYLKKRLGYDRDTPKDDAPPVTIRFEHDIFNDGE